MWLCGALLESHRAWHCWCFEQHQLFCVCVQTDILVIAWYLPLILIFLTGMPFSFNERWCELPKPPVGDIYPCARNLTTTTCTSRLEFPSTGLETLRLSYLIHICWIIPISEHNLWSHVWPRSLQPTGKLTGNSDSPSGSLLAPITRA